MKIKEQTRKLAAGCSKHCFEVADKTDEVSSKHGFEVVDETDEVSNHTYGKATLTRIEEIFGLFVNCSGLKSAKLEKGQNSSFLF
ncbi:chlorohydrolase [Streptococcus pneumoniae]|nr:chlorohydrolase [Streptococcus pneumoniae]VPJ94879.1 chlorohydrolase [Streptococcus pneumoniae]VPP56284.1 chlorohydrolase [Streptococcus pneumoniae]VRD75226.1 chlorohydrolase [Streptococcus pneumoniae]VRH52279.1 chlorohydrolase [Streptococcus pneumoniae]